MLRLRSRRRSSPTVVFFVADRVSASSRLRVVQYIDWLEGDGFRVRVCATRPSKYLRRPVRLPPARWARVPYLTVGLVSIVLQRLFQICFVVPRATVVFLQKDLLFHSRLIFLERLLFRVASCVHARVVFDIDDAIYLGTSRLACPHMPAKIATIAARSTAILAGSHPIESRLRDYCREVSHQPTHIRVSEPVARTYALAGSTLRVAWTGTPTNACHLDSIVAALTRVREVAGVRVELVTRLADLPVDMLSGLDVRLTEWSDEDESAVLRRADIALAPMAHTQWAAAKSGGRILSYFRAGIPVIASPVGMQAELVRHGLTGLLATTNEEWASGMLALREHETLRCRLGQAGRAVAEAERSAERAYPAWRDRVLGSAWRRSGAV